MADWKTYAKAARNTARKQAPGARDAAKRATSRAGDYARAAGRAVDAGRDEERGPTSDEQRHDPRHPDQRQDDDRGPSRRRPAGPEDTPTRERTASRDRRPSGEQSADDESRRASSPRRQIDTDALSKGAAAYYTVAERRVRSAAIVPRILRSLRDAILIGLSLLAIWLVLAAAGLQIPFSAVVIAVLVIVVISFATGMYSRFRHRDTETGEDDPAS